jgi:hypothetical protein
MNTINEIIRSEVRKVVGNTFWNQAPKQPGKVYATIRIVSDTSIHDKDGSIPNAIKSLRLGVLIYAPEPLILKQYARLLQQHMRKVKNVGDEDMKNVLHEALYIVGKEGYIADTMQFYQTLDFTIYYTAVEDDLTAEELDAMIENDVIIGPDIQPTIRKVNLSTHIIADDPYDPDAPLTGWTPPEDPRLNDTAIVQFPGGLGFYKFNGTVWVLDFFQGASGGGPLQGFSSMDAAFSALGGGQQFYYLEENTDGATAGSIHITLDFSHL